jgi:molybdopterin/thiamine biosynthesis adenylyltransferase/rhodanese-related sulfurtransferase
MTTATGILGAEELARYNRHLILPEVGLAGQETLKKGSVLLVGAGGLGSPLALYLAAAGVGRLGVVDFDRVDFSNLQRQIIHFTGDVGRSKLESARDKILAVNPNVTVDAHETRLDASNAMALLADYDVIVDGTDNFATRYLVNDCCVLLGKPNVYGSIFRFEGQASVFDATRGPCYRCLYPAPPPPGMVPNCAEGGVLGILPGVIGSLQATETLKLLLGIGEPLVGRLMLYDALGMRFREVRMSKDPDCPICGDHPTITGLIDYDEFCGIGQEEEDDVPGVPEITPLELSQCREDVHLVDVREPHELGIAAIPGATLIPLGDLMARFGEIDTEGDVVVMCRSGKRSAFATRFLLDQGLSRVRNLRGGILAWADEVDPTVQKY